MFRTKKVMGFTLAFAVLVASVLAVPVTGYAQESLELAHDRELAVPLYSVEDFFTFPEIMSYNLAPDGEGLIFAAPVDGVINVFSRDIETGEVSQLTFEEEQHVLHFFFKEDILLFMQDEFGDENFSIFRANPDGTKTNLTPYPGIASPLDLLEDTYADEEIMIMMNRDDPTVFNIYRLNVVTGEIELVFPAMDGLMFDNDGVSRVIVQVDDANITFFHRYTEDEEFELVKTLDFRDTFGWFFFDPTNEYVYGLSNIGRDTIALVRVDPATGEELEILFEHERYDIAMPIAGVEPGTLEGVLYIGDFWNIVFFDEESETAIMYNQARAHFGEGSIISLNTARENRDVGIVTVSSDVNRGRQYLFNRVDDTMTMLTDRNFTDTDHMAPMTPVRYTARDGLEIQGYLTVPVGVVPENLPVVVIVHGGPWARDMWLFNDEVQFLANRGYAVFQPNFRGSTGFGRAFVDAGDGEWGRAMQDDVTDGVLWLIEQGIADPDRVAIYGGSYGGYSALAGITFTPDVFAAAIAYVPVSSIFTLLESIPPQWENQRRLFYERVGHPVYDYELLRATSPVYHVDRITTPLFIAHGANDVRTTLIESVQIVQALDDIGVDVKFMVRWDEGHGFFNQQNRLEFYSTMEAFLAEHIGGRSGRSIEDVLGYIQTLDEVLAFE